MFTIRDYLSDETYDLGKFMNFKIDAYDVINSPLLNKIGTLPVARYYSVADGYKDIDRISIDTYGDAFFSFYILYYNNLQDEKLDESITLKLFSLDDFYSMYYDLANGIV